MKVRITKNVDTETEVDVSFPLYLGGGDSSDVSADSWDYFIRIDEDGSLWRLTVRSEREGMEYEFQYIRINIASGELSQYWPRPGSTYHVVDKKAFDKAVAEALAVLSGFPV